MAKQSKAAREPAKITTKSQPKSQARPKRPSSSNDAPRTSPGGELHQIASGDHPVLTTNQGLPISDNQNSLKANPRGPVLLEDFVLREKITHFDHERIPERVVHARGTAAHGFFELTRSLGRYTTARILTEVGEKTPVFTRISTVAGGAGSVDTPRDVRGFAVKFYTKEGNWDFISLTPEAMHMVMWIMSDRTLPRSLRMIEGFGIHTFRLVNAQGESTFVKFHWRPKLGLQSTIWDETVKISGADPDFHRRDMFEAIEAGNFPEWEFAVQLFTQAEADDFPFDHLDATKLIPEELVPLQVIGRMVLDRWPDNFFAETEQVAYCPSHIVPGIDFSNDPLLQGRLFSYLDTQLSRLGSPNFHQIPVNAPKCPFANQQRDAHMQMTQPKGQVAYEPNSLSEATPRESPARGFRSAAIGENGDKGRIRAESFADHYSQARQFLRSQTSHEQAHMASALVFELSKLQHGHIPKAMVGHLRLIDEKFAQRVANGLGLDALPPAPAAAAPVQDLAPSPALQTIGKMNPTLQGRAVGILVDEGSDGAVIAALKKAATGAGASVKIVARTVGETRLKDGSTLKADGQLAGTPSIVFDAVAVVLSDAGARKLAKESAAVDFVRDAFGHLKAIAVDAGGRSLLRAAAVPDDEGVTGSGDLPGFIRAAKTRQWQREASVRTLA